MEVKMDVLSGKNKSLLARQLTGRGRNWRRLGSGWTKRHPEMLEKYYQPWIELAQSSKAGVHCGECGCYNKTPHEVFLAWFRDVHDILASHQIGFAVWNFIGDFGVLDSGRTDVAYEDWHGHQLDRQFLDLLRK